MITLREAEITRSWKKEYGSEIVVDILCIAYNQASYVGMALDGFLMQRTTFPFRIVIHDDASTDGTTQIIREYERHFPNLIHAMYEEENQYSKKDGKLAQKIDKTIRGEYIALCEGDDYWTDEKKLQKQYDFMRENPAYSMCFHPVKYLSGDSFIKDDRHYDRACDIPASEIIEQGGMYCATCSLFYRASLRKDKPNWMKMSDVGDYPMQILCSFKGKIRYLPEIMGVYRCNAAGSWTSAVKKDREKEIRHCRTQIKWMKELDRDTGGAFRDSIYRHMIRVAYFNLLFLGDIPIKTVFENTGMLSRFGERARFNAKAVNLLIRKKLRKSLPGLYRLYKRGQ